MQVSTDSTFLTASRDSAGIVDTTFRTGILAGSTRYYWRVAGANAGGTGTWSAVRSFTLSLEGVEPVLGQVPTAFALSQNYPNPFNPATKIAFSLPAASSVRLVVFDIEGREVAVVAQGELAPGVYTTTFDAGASHLASGVYFYRLTASAGGKAYAETRKLLLVR